ncbi:hypothetical protein [Burkholderia sp. IMCC1007]|uniref:hypothetical protein n=1 Tax=Burkholderia sp. IMCC1007 TaxID=3004104 RepID=UPI0022B3FDC6|nr:hypothetical protein [Burkholderia sp. IMCC1007]
MADVAVHDDIAASRYVRERFNNPCSTRMTSLRIPTTRRSAATVSRSTGTGGQRMRRAWCAMPRSA